MCCSRQQRRPFSWLLLSSLANCRRCCRWRLVVVFAVSLLSAASICRHHLRILVVGLLASCHLCCIFVVGGGFLPCGYFRRILHLVIVVSVGVSLSLFLSVSRCRRWRLIIVGGVCLLSLLDSRCRRRRLVVVVGVLLLSLFRRCCW